jgi:hypothetical protein
MKLRFVSVNGPRETYLLDEPRIINNNNNISQKWMTALVV